MIYLLEDKKARQESYGWSSERLEAYREYIQPIYRYAEIENEEDRIEIFKDGNVILFHESFFDNIDNEHKKDSLTIRKSLEQFAGKHSIHVAYFSGTKKTRKLDGNTAYLSPDALYYNLESFIRHYAEGDTDFRYLLWGENHDIEKRILDEISHINNNDRFEECEAGKKVLVIKNFDSDIAVTVPFTDAEEIEIAEEAEDDELDRFVRENLDEDEYDAIYVPLCFGTTLSDYNGLRLALHIRCTNTRNQLKPLYIYGVVSHDELANNGYYDILKTREVYLTGYRGEDLYKALGTGNPISEYELPVELKKVHISRPTNYSDNHSIANEWAIYRWANTLDADDDGIEDVMAEVSSNIYFKYLSTIYPVTESQIIKTEDLDLKADGNDKKAAKILYVDDEADKGWNEIISCILYDSNKINFDYLDEELNDKTQEEIIDTVMQNIKSNGVNIVILDFRLHKDDFNEGRKVHEMTGYKILNEIKKYNHGIQVIMLSATNKIWNLMALQKAGADGFVLKEAPENSIDPMFTRESIMSLRENLSRCIAATRLYSIYNEFNRIRELAKANMNEDMSDNVSANLDIAFQLIKQSYDNLKENKELSNKFRAYSYLQLFQIIESYVQNENVFGEYAGLYYVEGLKNRFLVIQNIEGEEKKCKCSLKFTSGHYVPVKSETTDRKLDTNFRMSAVLIYLYGCETSAEHKWTSIYKARNEKAAHPERGLITLEEYQSIINLIKFIFNYANRNEEKHTALPDKSEEEKLADLAAKLSTVRH